MRRDRERSNPEVAEAISIVGPGMTFVGNCETEGTIRVEGRLEGSVRAGRMVVVGPAGVINGDVHARNVTVAGTVKGTVVAEARLELQETSRVDGEVFARTVQVGEGAVLNAAVRMGDDAVERGMGRPASGPKLLHPEPTAASA